MALNKRPRRKKLLREQLRVLRKKKENIMNFEQFHHWLQKQKQLSETFVPEDVISYISDLGQNHLELPEGNEEMVMVAVACLAKIGISKFSADFICEYTETLALSATLLKLHNQGSITLQTKLNVFDPENRNKNLEAEVN